MAENSHTNNFTDEEMEELKSLTPERLWDNTLVLFFRCKYARREAFKERLTQHEKERIDLELDRIERLRSGFHKHVDNSPLFESLKDSQSNWRRYAKLRSPDEQRRVQGLLNTASTTNDEEKIERYRRELRILSAFERLNEFLPPNTGREEDKSYGLLTYKIELKRSPGAKNSTTPSYKDYSIKRYPLHDVLDKKEKNPLMEPCGKDTLRYFRFPANNMLWVEQAIGRYYGEDRGEYDYRKAPNYRPKSSNLLCREFWTAQQHGSIVGLIHARHMRSQCAFISPEQEAEDDVQGNGCNSLTAKSSNNFVIFMPYLHWDTDKRRRKMADVMKNVTQKHRKDLQKESPLDRFAETVGKAQEKLGARTTSDPLTIKRPNGGREPSPLLRYLIDVAKVYEAMEIEPDMRLLREHLHPVRAPPLHARRTLDQSYHWKLENTGRRDEDQVVYRGTRAGKTTHRTTRVIMVDQLWLYILDDNTILSFFPRRWGRNKPDFSGVHRGIRAKLEHLRPGDVQSVYDLALIIMNQCSKVFFDRTKPADDRPQVLDIFTNAIAYVSEMKTIAFENFWRHLKKLRLNDPHQKDMSKFQDAARIYLEVNPEGKLMREAHDIMDELRMMCQIYFQQLRVTKYFTKHLQALNEQKSPSSKREILQSLNKTLEEISSRQAGTISDGHINGHMNGHMNGNINRTAHRKNSATSGIHRPVPDGTMMRAQALLEDIETRRNELWDLEENTKEITEHLKDLLDLKQQASIIEAKLALDRADESVTQGRAIMMFTVITIIFLPLSYMSSLFGMNARELSGPDGSVMSLHYQFIYMFTISLAVIVVALTLAFSTSIRSLFSLLANLIRIAITEYTGLEHLWKLCIQSQEGKYLNTCKQNFIAKINRRKSRKEYEKIVADARSKEKQKSDREQKAKEDRKSKEELKTRRVSRRDGSIELQNRETTGSSASYGMV